MESSLAAVDIFQTNESEMFEMHFSEKKVGGESSLVLEGQTQVDIGRVRRFVEIDIRNIKFFHLIYLCTPAQPSNDPDFDFI